MGLRKSVIVVFVRGRFVDVFVSCVYHVFSPRVEAALFARR